MRIYWKSRKKVLKVKSYDRITGETVWRLFPEGHQIDPDKGEEAESDERRAVADRSQREGKDLDLTITLTSID